MNEKAIIILTTVSSADEAENIATDLVNSRLAACVNIVPNVLSIYRWKNKIDKEEENQLIIKTSSECEEQVYDYIRNKHSYDVPEILTVNINNIDKSYAEWLISCLKQQNNGKR